MRLFTVWATVLAVTLAAAPAHAQPVTAQVRQEAFAGWMVPIAHHGHVTRYKAFAVVADRLVGTDPPGSVTLAGALEGACKEVRQGQSDFVNCWYRGLPHRIRDAGFTIDPQLRSARVRFRTGGTSYSAVWVGHGSGTYGGYTHTFGCTATVDVPVTGLWADAKASGRGFNRTFSSRTKQLSMLLEGPETYDCIQSAIARRSGESSIRVRFQLTPA